MPTAPQPTLALSRLFGSDLEPLRRAWGREALLESLDERDAGDAFADLFSPEAVDELIAERGLRAPFLRIAKSGSALPDAQFTAPGGVGAGVPDQVSEDKVRRLFADGATIVLQGLHRTWTPIRDFSQALASELGHPVQVNAYVTPASNQGFSAHYDVHDVFVLQITGAKHWVVHDPVWPVPLRSQTWDAHASEVAAMASGPPIIETDLSPGDVLYLPRGFVHSARALGGTTIHLTIGLHVWTQYHLAEAYLDAVRAVLATDEAVRASLPLGVDVSDADQLRPDAAGAREAIETALAGVRTDQLAAALLARSRGSSRPASLPPLAQLTSADALTPDTPIALRPHLLASLEDAPDGRVVVRSRAGRFPLPAELRPALERLLAGECVRAGEFGDAARALLVEGVGIAR